MNAALIITGPEDGKLIACPLKYLDLPVLNKEDLAIQKFADMAVCDEPLPIEKLSFKRAAIDFPNGRCFNVFVPLDWPNDQLTIMVLEHLLMKAFKA